VVDAFSSFSLPQISAVARRTALAALTVGVVALGGLTLAGYPLAGLGACLGLSMALANFRLISVATVKASSSPRADKRRPLAINTLGRLGVISVIALALVFVSQQLGFGTLVGLAAFQFMLLANVMVSMLRDHDTADPDHGELP
jgi:hypothetical protein